MIIENLTTLKINQLTKAQYEAALAAGTVNENELYMTEETNIDLSTFNEHINNSDIHVTADEKSAWSEAVEIQLPVSGWSAERDENGYFYQRVDVTGMTARRSPIVNLKVTSTESQAKEEYCYGYIKNVETYDGYIICRIVNMIDTDLTIELKGV